MEHPRLATLVAVQWKANLFDAKVLHVPPAGEMDVVYDIAGSVGVFLTMEEHGLKLLEIEETEGGGEKKERSVGGYSNKVAARELCLTRRRKPCSVDGCFTKAADVRQIRRGKGKCLRESCTTPA